VLTSSAVVNCLKHSSLNTGLITRQKLSDLQIRNSNLLEKIDEGNYKGKEVGWARDAGGVDELIIVG
jgi:hypothetical protein